MNDNNFNNLNSTNSFNNQNFNNQPAAPTAPDEMIGPNPFDVIRSYEEAGNNRQTAPLNNTFPNPTGQNQSNISPNSIVHNNPLNNNMNTNEQFAQDASNEAPITYPNGVENNNVPFNNTFVNQNVNSEIQNIPNTNASDELPQNSQLDNISTGEQIVEPLPSAEPPITNPEPIPTPNNTVESSNQTTQTLEQPNIPVDNTSEQTPNTKEEQPNSTEQIAEPIVNSPTSDENSIENTITESNTLVEEFNQPDTNEETTINLSNDYEDINNRLKIDQTEAISKEEAIFKGEKYRITVLSEILIRLEYSETGNFEDRPTELARFRNFDVPKLEVTNDEKILTIKSNYFELTYEKEKPFTGTKFSPDQYLKIKLLDTDKMWFFGHAEARNFKSTTSTLDDASTLPKLEKGLYSTDGFVSLDDSKTLIFNEDGSIGKRNDARIDTYLFMYKKDFGFCLKDFYQLTGYPPLIPRYALGVWWNRDEVYNTEEIKSLIAKFQKYEIPISVLLLNKWSANDVTFDKEIIDNPTELIKTLHKENIHLGIELKLESVPATKNGERIEIPFNIYDKEFVVNYFKTFIRPLNTIGVDFYSLNYRGKDMQILRSINHYFYKFMNTEPNKRGLILSRNGLINSHLYPINNSGEIIVDWKTLKMIPEFNSTGSNLGISWWSHAIGGYKDGIEESELYTRFVQLGTYSPIFRFSSKGGHYYKREPWRWDVKTRKIVKDYTNLRHKLIPYLYSESYKYSKSGLPLIQPLYYRYPELYDEPLYRNEYYFGTELFIAPITERRDNVMNRTVARLFLPNGMWYDFKTGKKFPGGKRYISFYQDEDYPVFAKQGAIIPQALIDEENRNTTDNPEVLEIHIFPGKNNTYKLYEDDGKTNSYKDGNYTTTSIDYNYLPNNYTVIIRNIEGKVGIIPEKRKYKIRFRNTRQADDVIVYLGPEKIEVKSYLDDQDFIVETDYVSTNEQLSINCKGKDIEIDAVRIINEDIDTIISDLKIPTKLKEKISEIMFSENDVKKKRIEIRKLSKLGLNDLFIKMFLKLLEYVGEF